VESDGAVFLSSLFLLPPSPCPLVPWAPVCVFMCVCICVYVCICVCVCVCVCVCLAVLSIIKRLAMPLGCTYYIPVLSTTPPVPRCDNQKWLQTSLVSPGGTIAPSWTAGPFLSHLSLTVCLRAGNRGCAPSPHVSSGLGVLLSPCGLPWSTVL
jgi:hypothetical protein